MADEYVLDEAHKGAGEYSYAKVVRFLMAKNPYFRVLALTATPGRTPEAVQAIVDSLHISRIELRDEQSLDIRSYINEKVWRVCLFATHLKQDIVRKLSSI
jgi:ATP-dependent DNA helicase MPH1